MRVFSDEEIKNIIVDHLDWNTRIDASRVLVSIDNGLVTLTGTVNSHAEKQEAFEAARHVSGVRAVSNEIIVFHPSEKDNVPDREIEEAVKQAFAWSPYIDKETIDVRVSDGTVTLRGCVRHYSQRLKAETIISEFKGVKKIVDELSIVCTDKIEDEHIANAIMNEVKNTDPNAAEKINITVNNGFVDISGTVDSYPAEKRVFDAVSHTNGVTGIKNNLSVAISRNT